ncbi:MAG TPA: hypothetical protein PKC72_16475 [Chitinophagaceae bacterium]|nr:hypothetical protein [Chitinophagaceae bacterium]
MKKFLTALVIFFLIFKLSVFAQPVDSIRFFTDDKLVDLTLTTDIRNLQNQKGDEQYQDASVVCRFPDSTTINEQIRVCARGVFRRDYCRIPPMFLNFRNPTSPRLHPLGKLKLVIGCGMKTADEELLLKEYLTYKIYNLLEEKSFRVRLMNVHYNDTRNKIKPFSQYAFLIEDDADMARRNGCKKKDYSMYLTEATDRQTMTMVAIFQYMIGNTDWAVPNDHNVKLIFDRKNEYQPPFVVPYDFDYCGLVNAGYAIPHEIIGTESVTERVYRGFPRSMEEIQVVLDVFRAQKQNIYSLISNFEPLSQRTRKEMIDYLDEFFRMIESKGQVKSIFIDNARTS